MNSQDIILTKVLQDKTHWRHLLDTGVDASFFTDRRPLFQYVQSFYADYGELPAVDVVQQNFPKWTPLEHDNSIEFWIDQLRADRSLLLQNEALEAYVNAKDEPAEKKAQIWYKLVHQLSMSQATRDISLKNIEAEKSDYLNKKASKGAVGIPLGIRFFDEATGGSKGGDLGVVMGPPANMKTFVLTYMSWHTWVHDESPLIMSKEMSEKEIRDRLSFFDYRFPYSHFKQARLGTEIESRYFEALEKRKERKEFIISADDGDMDKGGGINLLAAKIDQYRPTIVFVDGGYLMTDDRGAQGWEATKNVFRDMKRLARSRGIPIIVSTQPQRLKEKNGEPLRRKLTMEDVGGAYTIAQDADYMLGVRKKNNTDTLEIYTIKMREGNPYGECQMVFNLETGEIRELGEEEQIIEDVYPDETTGELKFD